MILSFHFFTGGKCYFCSQCSLHEKPYFLFGNVLKISFFQKMALEYDLCCIVMKDGICFPENMILFFRRKMKDVLSQKIRGNMIFFIYLV